MLTENMAIVFRIYSAVNETGRLFKLEQRTRKGLNFASHGNGNRVELRVTRLDNSMKDTDYRPY